MKRSRLLLTITIIFFWASEYCHAPYFTPYLQTLGFTAGVIGLLTGAYGFTQMLPGWLLQFSILPIMKPMKASGLSPTSTLSTVPGNFWPLFSA